MLADNLFAERATHLQPNDPTHDRDYRRRRILSELEQSNSDILCLQEVPNHTDTFYKKELE